MGNALRHSPQSTCCLILAHQSDQMERARSLGLQAILLEGMTAASLAQAIDAGGRVEPDNLQ